MRRFPTADAGGRWKVSTGGGKRARWSADGRTILYQNDDLTAIHATRVTPGSTFVVGATETVMRIPVMHNAWDVDRATGRSLLPNRWLRRGADRSNAALAGAVSPHRLAEEVEQTT